MIDSRHVILFLAVALLMAAVGIGVAFNNQIDVSTLGKYGDVDGYVNNVKLEEGSNITITPSGAHNSLVISSTGGGGEGDITAVGDADTGAAFTADGEGTQLWFEGATPDDWEIILTSDDPSGSDFTITLPSLTGEVVLTSGSQTLVDKTLTSPIIQGTVGAGTGLIMPGFALDGPILVANDHEIVNCGNIRFSVENAIERDVSDLYLAITGGTEWTGGGGGAIVFFGKDLLGGQILLNTPNLAQDGTIERLKIGGSGTITVATWASITHTGMVLSGALDANSQSIIEVDTITFEGATPDDWEVILASDDPSGSDFTATLSDHTGYITVDVTECWDLEGTGLSIAGGTLNWAMPADAIDASHFKHSEDWGEIITSAGGVVEIDASVILAANLANEDWGEIIISGNAATVDISGAVEESGFTSGDFLLFYDTTAGANRKVGYDDLPAGGGAGITAVGDVSGAVDAFTADSAGNTLWFEGATPNDYEIILTAADPTAQDWTITLPKATGYTVIDATVCSDIEGSGLAIDTAVLKLAALTEDWSQTGAFDIKLANASSELYIMESSGDTYYGILDVADLTSSDKTYTFPDSSGYVVIDTTVCTDLEGSGLSITAGTLNVATATATVLGIAKFDSVVGDDFVVTAGDVTLKDTSYVVVLTAAGAITDIGSGPCQTKVSGTNFDYYTCDFDPDNDEIVYWEFQIPNSYTGGNITPTVYWISTAIVGDTEWEMQVLGRTDSEAYDAALGAVQTIKTTTDGTAGNINTSTFSAFNPGWAAGDLVIVKLYRNADDAIDDTMTTDARMLNIRLSWPSAR